MSTLTSANGLTLNKPSIRVHAPPGGVSHFSLGWEEPTKSEPSTQKKKMERNAEEKVSVTHEIIKEPTKEADKQEAESHRQV